jgi:hypothetical protein
MKRFMLAVVSLAIGAAVWLPMMHLVFRPGLDAYRADGEIGPRTGALAAHRLDEWLDPVKRESDERR